MNYVKHVSPVFFIQARLGDKFEDMYIRARTPERALEKAKKQTTLKHRFTNFVF